MWRSHRSVVANVLDCDIVVSEFEFQARCYVYYWTNALGKGMKEHCFHLSATI